MLDNLVKLISDVSKSRSEFAFPFAALLYQLILDVLEATLLGYDFFKVYNLVKKEGESALAAIPCNQSITFVTHYYLTLTTPVVKPGESMKGGHVSALLF